MLQPVSRVSKEEGFFRTPVMIYFPGGKAGKDLSKTKERIRESNLRYRHALGQNFIYDEDLLAALAEAAGISPGEDVLEIGPGSGSLTKHLCARAHTVLSLELDDRLIPLLRAFMSEWKNFRLEQGDVMTVDLHALTADLIRPFAVVANIPYYITTPLIMRLLTAGLPLSRLALMVQKEVAEKILSSPGEEGWGPLAVHCRYFCEPELAMDVPAEAFTPRPKVDSAFILLPFRKEPAVRVRSEADFFRMVGAAFALRRKTMTNALVAAFHLERTAAAEMMTAAGLEQNIRGEKLTLEELAALADVWTERKGAENGHC